MDTDPAVDKFAQWFRGRHGVEPDREAAETLADEWMSVVIGAGRPSFRGCLPQAHAAPRTAPMRRMASPLPRPCCADEPDAVVCQLAGLVVLPYDRRVAGPTNDSWIAACCLVRDLPLATFSIKDIEDFDRTPAARARVRILPGAPPE